MKKSKYYIMTAIGILVLILGLYLVKTTDAPQAFMAAFSYVCIGFGCGIFGYGMSSIISNKILQKNPDLQRQNEINEKDERNIIISNRAKAKAYDLMSFVFGVLMLIFALMNVDMIAIILFCFVYLFLHGYEIYYHCKYEKEM